MSWTPYVVRQGDHLEQLAERFGFDAPLVWNDPRNRALRERRHDPAMLAPGDVLHVPKSPSPHGRFAHRDGNDYVARRTTARVKLALRDADGPLAGLRCKVAPPDGEPFFVTSGPDGMIDFEVPLGAREVPVFVEARAIELRVRPGELDPLDEPGGARQRLANLGYYPLSHDGAPARDEDHLDALRAFKRDHRLGDGDALDRATLDALRRAHGA